MKSKKLIGYAREYIVWEDGRVTGGIKKDQPLKHGKSKDGPSVRLYKQDGTVKFWHVSRLLAICFIPNPQNKPVVQHKDGDIYNNNLSNLVWSDMRKVVKSSYDRGTLVPPMTLVERVNKTKICAWCKNTFEYSYQNKDIECCSRSCGSKNGHAKNGHTIRAV